MADVTVLMAVYNSAAYLRPALARPNLTVLTGATVSRMPSRARSTSTASRINASARVSSLCARSTSRP